MELFLPVFAALITTAYGCSAPGRDRHTASLEEKVYKSQYVVYGTVLDILPDPVYKGEDIYAAHISVKCTYKGGMLASNITVVGAGIMAQCPEVNLLKMTDYILLLKSRSDKYYDVEFGPMSGDPQMLDEILIVCDLVLTYTKGSQAEKNNECPEIFEDLEDGDDCLRYSPSPNKTSLSTRAPITTAKVSEKIITSDLEKEQELDQDIKINDADGTESKSVEKENGTGQPAISNNGRGEGKGQSAISDNGNGKELYSLPGFLLFTCTTVASFLL